MPLFFLGAAALGAMVWNQFDDAIIDPVTGSGNSSPLLSPAVVFLVGAAVGVIAKKKGFV